MFLQRLIGILIDKHVFDFFFLINIYLDLDSHFRRVSTKTKHDCPVFLVACEVC
jgi:hypothetical protein